MSLKALLSASLLVSLLAGCGVNAGPTAALRPADRPATAAASTKGTILYGAWFTAEVRKVEKAPGKQWGPEARQLTLEVTGGSERWDDGLRGKLVIVFSPREGTAPAIRVGDVVAGFVNYPTVDLQKKTFVNVPGKPSFVLDLDVLPRS